MTFDYNKVTGRGRNETIYRVSQLHSNTLGKPDKLRDQVEHRGLLDKEDRGGGERDLLQ